MEPGSELPDPLWHDAQRGEKMLVCSCDNVTGGVGAGAGAVPVGDYYESLCGRVEVIVRGVAALLPLLERC